MQLTTAVLFLLSTIYGGPTIVTTEDAITRATFAPETVVSQPLTLENYVRVYFKDAPILAEIAKCESRFRHVGRDGKVIRGEAAPEDVGVMQINEFYHEDTAEILGFDLHALDGNLAYAKWLYAKEGTTPWLASGKCWQKSDRLAQASSLVASN